MLPVRLDHAVTTASHRAGDAFTGSLVETIRVDDTTVIPKGTRFRGRVVSSKPSGRLTGRAVLSVALTSFELDGETYHITTAGVTVASGNHRKRNAALIGGGSGAGALVGGLAGGGQGALIGAGVGAAAGTAGAAATGKRNAALNAEAQVRFKLKEPVFVRLSRLERAGPGAVRQ